MRMVKTTCCVDISPVMVEKYLYSNVDKIYKILPLKESKEDTLGKYIRALVRELLGCQELIDAFQSDSRYLDVISVLMYMSSHIDEMDIDEVRSDVFRCINLMKTLRRQHESWVK